MDNLIQQRIANKFYFEAELSAKTSFETLLKTYGESCLKETTINDWFDRFRDDQERRVDDNQNDRLPQHERMRTLRELPYPLS